MQTVTVGCKLPNGLHLDHAGKRVTLNGANASQIIGGCGFTTDVDKDFFDAWCTSHADFPPLKLGLIFAQNKKMSTEAEAREKETLKTGFEGLDPEKPMPGITKADKE